MFGQDYADILASGGYDPFTGISIPDISLPSDGITTPELYGTGVDIYSPYYNPITGQLELPVGMSASAQPIVSTPSLAPSTGGIFQSVLSAGASIAAAILGSKTTSPTLTSATPYYNPATGKYQATPVTTTGVTSITSLLSSLTSNLPLLAIVGGGAYFLLRKKKGRK